MWDALSLFFSVVAALTTYGSYWSMPSPPEGASVLQLHLRKNLGKKKKTAQKKQMLQFLPTCWWWWLFFSSYLRIFSHQSTVKVVTRALLFFFHIRHLTNMFQSGTCWTNLITQLEQYGDISFMSRRAVPRSCQTSGSTCRTLCWTDPNHHL